MRHPKNSKKIFADLIINGIDWKNEVTAIDRMAKLTKEDIVAFPFQLA